MTFRKTLVFLNLLAPLLGLGLLWAGHGWWALGLVFGGHMLWLWATLVPSCAWFGPVVTHSGNEAVVLTFDDGPHPEHTPWVLDQLASVGLKGVFFLIGERAAAHPDLVQRIQAEGHVIGNHSQRHLRFQFWRLGKTALGKEVLQAQATLENLTGKAPTLFRSPVGHHPFWLWPVLEEASLTLFGWSARGLDGVSLQPGKILNRLLPKLQPGVIVLLHDDRPSIHETLPVILASLQKRGLRVGLPSF